MKGEFKKKGRCIQPKPREGGSTTQACSDDQWLDKDEMNSSNEYRNTLLSQY